MLCYEPISRHLPAELKYLKYDFDFDEDDCANTADFSASLFCYKSSKKKRSSKKGKKSRR